MARPDDSRLGLRSRRGGALAAGLAACLAAGACAGAGEDPSAPSVVFAPVVSTGCQSLPAAGHVIPADISWFVLRALDGSGQEAFASAFDRDEVSEAGLALVRGVPKGSWRLELTGCGTGGVARWWGEAPAVTVDADGKASPLFWMQQSGALTCVGGLNENPLAPAFQGDGFLAEGLSAFATASTSPGGRVLLAGGGTEYKPETGRLVAGEGLWELDGYAGVFRRVRAGNQPLGIGGPRMLHQAAFLDENHLVVAGGVTTATLMPYIKATPDPLSLFPGKRPPVVPEDMPQHGAVVVSLDDGTVSPVGAMRTRLPAVALDVARKRVALIGGMNADETPAGGGDLLFLDGAAPKSFPDLAPRFGGAAAFLSTGQLVLAGGRSTAGAATPELFDPATGTSASLPRPAADTAFPALAVLQDDGKTARVLVGGGNVVGGATFDYDNPGKVAFWVLSLAGDGTAYDAAQAVIAPIDVDTTSDSWPLRTLGGLVPWDEPGSFLWVGGVRQRRTTNEDAPACQGSQQPYCLPPMLEALRVNGAALAAATPFSADAEGRLGPAATRLGPGRVLVQGGLSSVRDSDARPLSSGVIAFAGGATFDAVCAAHPAPAVNR